MNDKGTYIPYKRLALLLVAIVLIGTIGYVVLEQWTWWDALYMTIITLSTVGFQEVSDLHWSGRLFTLLLILAGVSGFALIFSTIMQGMLAGHLSGVWQSSKIRRRIRSMEEHYIVCGYGRVGSKVVERLRTQSYDIVVVDLNPDIGALLVNSPVHFIHGDATQEDTFRAVGIDQACGLVCCLPHDADNLFAVLTARTMNADIHIIARVDEESTEAKMRFAGANDVVNPGSIAGRTMAMRLIEPDVVRVIDMLTTTGLHGNLLETVQVLPDSELVGQNIGEIGFRRRFGVSVLQILRADQTLEVDITAETDIRPHDILMILGKRTAVMQFHAHVHANLKNPPSYHEH